MRMSRRGGWLLRWALAATAASGCAGAADGETETIDGVDEAGGALATTGGYKGKYNQTQDHWVVCVRLKNGAFAQLRYPDGMETGYALTWDQLAYDAAVPTDETCDPGEVRLDLLEMRPSPGGKLVFHRGGQGYLDHKRVRYGHLSIEDLEWDGDLSGKVRLEGDDDDENGQPCPATEKAATKGHYYVRPKPIESDMKYCRTGKSCSDNPISYRGYGDPAQVNGTLDSVHYTYLTWNWINVAGGGVARALLKKDDVFHRCNVPAIRLASVTEGGTPNGWVQAIYGKTRQGSEWYYGWMVHSHRFTPPGQPEGPVVWHVARVPQYY